MDDLIKRIKEECAGRDRWYVMNATEDGYCIDFDRERDADRWVADRLRESPGYMERNGYHVVKRRSFTSAEELANEAAARLTALESERDALLAAAGKEAVPIGYVQASALPLLKRGAADTIFGDCHECADVPLYTAPTAAPETGDGRDAERGHWNPVYNTDPVQRACGELPEGWEIQILLERDAGCVYLIDPNGERSDIDNADKFDWTIHEAIDAALSQQKEVLDET